MFQLFRISITVVILGCSFANPSLARAELTTTSPSILTKPDAPGAVSFTPPTGWRLADTKDLPKHVHVMVVGQSQHGFPPSMNLGTERYPSTLKAYLKIVKGINDAQGFEWKDLGSIRTEAGEASLSQVDSKTPWGDVRMMHVILLKNGTVYILTAAALKEEFPQFYKDFFQSLRSLHINKDVFEMVQSPSKRASLQKQVATLTNGWNEVNKTDLANTSTPSSGAPDAIFSDETFQSKYWIPFTNILDKEYSDMGSEWKQYMIAYVKDALTDGRKVTN